MNAPVTDLLNTMLKYQEKVACDWCNESHTPVEALTVPRQFQVLHFCCQKHLEEFAQWRWSEPERD